MVLQLKLKLFGELGHLVRKVDSELEFKFVTQEIAQQKLKTVYSLVSKKTPKKLDCAVMEMLTFRKGME